MEIKYVSDKPAQSLKALKEKFSQSELKIKFTRTTMKSLIGDKLKFEAIKLI